MKNGVFSNQSQIRMQNYHKMSENKRKTHFLFQQIKNR